MRRRARDHRRGGLQLRDPVDLAILIVAIMVGAVSVVILVGIKLGL
jgi:hypothetical protein